MNNNHWPTLASCNRIKILYIPYNSQSWPADNGLSSISFLNALARLISLVISRSCFMSMAIGSFTILIIAGASCIMSGFPAFAGNPDIYRPSRRESSGACSFISRSNSFILAIISREKSLW